MSASGVQLLHGIYWGSTLISQISNARVNPGIQHLVTHGAGAPHPIFDGNIKQSPTFMFDTTQLKSVLDITGATIAASGGNVDMFFRTATSKGERDSAAGTTHYRKRMASSVLVPERITVRDGGEASLSCSLYAIWNGTDEPLVAAGSLALSGAPSSAEHYTTWPFKVN